MTTVPTIPEDLELSPDDLYSTTWLKISAHYTARLARLRKKNDQQLTPEQTAKLRGEIAEVRNLLALDSRIED